MSVYLDKANDLLTRADCVPETDIGMYWLQRAQAYVLMDIANTLADISCSLKDRPTLVTCSECGDVTDAADTSTYCGRTICHSCKARLRRLEEI